MRIVLNVIEVDHTLLTYHLLNLRHGKLSTGVAFIGIVVKQVDLLDFFKNFRKI